VPSDGSDLFADRDIAKDEGVLSAILWRKSKHFVIPVRKVALTSFVELAMALQPMPAYSALELSMVRVEGSVHGDWKRRVYKLINTAFFLVSFCIDKKIDPGALERG